MVKTIKTSRGVPYEQIAKDLSVRLHLSDKTCHQEMFFNFCQFQSLYGPKGSTPISSLDNVSYKEFLQTWKELKKYWYERYHIHLTDSDIDPLKLDILRDRLLVKRGSSSHGFILNSQRKGTFGVDDLIKVSKESKKH